MSDDGELSRELETARSTIAAQAVQIHQLQSELQRGSALEVLQQLLQLSEVVGVTVGHAPYRALLDGIVYAAHRLFDAGAASILLLDGETDELVFEAASGGADVVGLRIPAHLGIAGWVVMSGEPIAVSDVRRDPRWAKDFAQSIGYVPQSIMAVPLILGEEVEGVIELLDKASGTSFGLNDLDLLGLFARPAALAVEQARMVSNVGRLLVQDIGRLASQSGENGLAHSAQVALAGGPSLSAQTLELAQQVHRLSRKGDRAVQLAIEVLASVARYSG